MNRTLVRTGTAFVAVVTVASTMAPAAFARGGDDTIRRGSCSGATHWKLKVGPDNGRLEVEGEVDSNRNGQTWFWSIRHDGSLSASGTRVTRAPSGSFEVRRTVVNRPGTDTIVFRARNARTGELCRGTVNR
jgi:hypothetical protein